MPARYVLCRNTLGQKVKPKICGPKNDGWKGRSISESLYLALSGLRLSPILIVLLSVHLLLALGWLGGELMTSFVIGPGLRQMSLPSMLEFVAKVMPKAVNYVEWMIVGTGVSGILLAFFTPSQVASNSIIVSAGIILALLAAAVELVVTRPSFKRMASLADVLRKSGQVTAHPEIIKHEKRARWGSLAGSLLLGVVLVLMVVTGL